MGLICAIAVWLHTPGWNGPPYFEWAWRRLIAWQLVPAFALASVPFVVAQKTFRPERPAGALMLLSLTFVLMEFAGIVFKTWYFDPWIISRIVESPVATTYYTEAKSLMAGTRSPVDWLDGWPELMRGFGQHAKCKPPGLVLYYAGFIRMFGPGVASSQWGGSVIGIIAAAAPPATYFLGRALRGSKPAAFAAASFITLCPAPILFFPEFDQVYIPIAAVLVGLWAITLRSSGFAFAAAFGGLFAASLFLSHIFLIFGFVFLGLMILQVASVGRFAAALMKCLAAAAGLMVPYALLYLATGFDPIAVFLEAGRLQMLDSLQLARPFPTHLAYDLWDVLMSVAWVGILPVLFRLGSAVRSRHPNRGLAIICVLQFFLVPLTGLFPGENARILMAQIPLLLYVLGMELADWPPPARAVVYVTTLTITVCICRNMMFIF